MKRCFFVCFVLFLLWLCFVVVRVSVFVFLAVAWAGLLLWHSRLYSLMCYHANTHMKSDEHTTSAFYPD